MQRGYVYYLTEPAGKNFHSDFKPELTPKEMLKKNCPAPALDCRRLQRQALLHWAYDSRKI